ncbi:PP2C family protein-serine/threonine phosphatase [Streptomyces luomodiensis]|uniref:PP2C family protein-serine/threonine phosphatase n=1 Tax=Streptomyces luomodiensis TaxID=3026192 RepID=A0ABY9UPS9_9ACTN|nr:PP2C family protein-serine/threonine phosphatase [Streptomyces sp. SCA4-21]
MVVIPLLAIVAIMLGDVLTPASVRLSPLLIAAPAMTASFAGPLLTACVGGLAVVAQISANASMGLLGRPGRLTEVITLVLASALIVLFRAVLDRHRRELNRVRAVADVAQRVLLRPLPGRIGPLLIASVYLAAEPEAEIGGDLYAAARTSNTTRLIIGDVRGSGLTAVADASLVLGAFRALAHWPVPLTDLVAYLDTTLSAERTEPLGKAPGAGESFVTAAVLEIPDDQPVVRLVNCGHPPPILLRDSQVKELAGPAPALPLGLGHLASDGYRAADFPFGEGDQLLLYTDGVVEARDAEGTFYPLAERLPGWDVDGPQHLVDRLHRDLLSHIGGHQGDDAALVVLERHPAER